MAPHETRDVRLLDTQNFAGLGLGEAAFFDEAINLQGEAGFELLARGIGKAEVGKDVAAAFFDPDLGIPFHFSCAFLCNPVQRPQAAVLSSRFPFWVSICPSFSRRAGAGKALISLRDDPTHLTGFSSLSIYTIIHLCVYSVNKYR